MQTARVGIVGAGAITRSVHLPVLLSMRNVQVAWLADREEERARTLGSAYRVSPVPLPSVLEDLPPCDVVLLAIPVGYRRPYYEMLARRGTAVFAEKPFATTASEHKQIAALFAPERVGCGYMRRAYATTQLLRRAVHERWFGPLERLRITEGSRQTRTGLDTSHFDDPHAAGGGVLISLGCHALDQALFITGTDDFELLDRHLELDGSIDRKADARVRLNHVAGRCGETCELDFCVSWLDEQDNLLECIFANVELSAGIGPDAGVVLRPRGAGRLEPESFQLTRGARTTNQAFFLEWDHFLKGIEERQSSFFSAASSLPTAALIDAIYGKAGEAL